MSATSAEQVIGRSKGFCAICSKIVECDMVLRAGKIYQVNWCDSHGRTQELVYSNAADYFDALSQIRPGSAPRHRSGEVRAGCPDDCGICPDHEQHSCVGVIEINDACNLNCPVCYADAGGSASVPLATVKKMIDLYVRCEHEPEVLQISGGEPTLHPNIFEIMRYAGRQGIKFVLLNTNGIRLASRDFAERMAGAMRRANGQRQRSVVYLQFDGADDHIYQALRGRHLLEIKMKAIENCREVGLPVALVPTLVRGINLDAVGSIIELALADRNIKMINFQPITGAGRSPFSGDVRLTIPEVLDAIELQTGGSLTKNSFINIPCPHPTCSVCSYVYRNKEKTVELTGLLDLGKYLEHISDKAVPHAGLTTELKQAAQTLFSMSAVMGSPAVEDAICTFCGVKIPKIRELIDDITLISVHAFMDAANFNLDRVKKCCITQILPDGKMVPFCAYNVVHRQRACGTFSGAHRERATRGG